MHIDSSHHNNEGTGIIGLVSDYDKFIKPFLLSVVLHIYTFIYKKVSIKFLSS